MISLLLSSLLTLAPTLPAGAKPIIEGETEYVVSSPTPTDFKPTDESINRSTSTFDIFWNLHNSGDHGATYEMLTTQNRSQTTPSAWVSDQAQAQKDVGVDIERQIVRITWYPNPPNAEGKGTYTAIDFAARTGKGAFRCGYMVLFDDGANPVQIARVDTSQLTFELVENGLPRRDVLTQLPCYLGPKVATAFGKVDK